MATETLEPSELDIETQIDGQPLPVEAQAVPDQPVAWVNLAMWRASTDELPPLPEPAGGRLRYDRAGSLLPEPSYSADQMRDYTLAACSLAAPAPQQPTTEGGWYRTPSYLTPGVLEASPAAAADQPIPTLDQWIEALRGTGYLTWRQAHECATLVLNMLGAQCK